MTEYDDLSDDSWGMWDGQCQACDSYGPVDDMSLCETCGTMLERDLIRQRAWEYSAMAFGLPPDAREELRQQIIAQFGEALELISPEE